MSTLSNNTAVTDLLLSSMFFARRVVLWAGGILILELVLAEVDRQHVILAEGVQFLLVILAWISMVVVALGSLITFCFVFLAPLREMGLKYAISHLILCILLSIVGLLGIIIVPLLVSWEIERVRAKGDQAILGTG